MTDEIQGPPEPPEHLDRKAAEVWTEAIAEFLEIGDDPDRITGPDFDAYCAQVALQRETRDQIATDGAIVEDERGRPVPHPAIDLERDAQKEIRAWGERFKPKKPRSTGRRGPRAVPDTEEPK